jgi:hypothetical protein
MIEVVLERSIISFDGRVIETFGNGQPSQRYHVAHVGTAAIQTDKKGRQSLQIFMQKGGGFATGELPMEAAAKAQELVDEINRVRASLGLGV